MLQKKYDSQNTQTVIYTYDSEGKVGRITDTVNGLTHRYLYDISGRLTSHKEIGGDRKFITTLGYDANDNVSKISDQVGDLLYTNTYTFDGDNRPVKAKTSTTSDNLTYDAWGRLSTEVIQQNTNGAVTTTITYYNPANGRTSTLPATYSTAISNNTIGYTYTYDSNGYIASITDSAGKHRYYQYDKLGQLVREDDETAGDNGATWVFTYDNRGNITSRKHYNYTVNTPSGTPLETVNYTYKTTGWKDILTGVGGVTYTNDAIGNRTGDGTWTYTWEHGRQLASMSKTGTSITYAYGADGQRIGKSVTASGVTTATEYYYRDGQLIEMISGSDRMHFFYNANGTPISVLYNDTRYYYVRNAQGDIVALTTVTGQKAVTYSYDAWGKLLQIGGGLASTLGQANPLRYRGYVYDSETSLYYLGSRYYDPAVGRFINADAYVSTGQGFIGNNIFVYCLNSPINLSDKTGHAAEANSSDWYWVLWLLGLLDGPSPVLDILLYGGLIFTGELLIASDESIPGRSTPPNNLIGDDEAKTPDVKYPGNDSEKAPDGYEWRGKGKQGSHEGGYYNPQTKESLHPDLDHPEPIGPHWDYNFKGSGHDGWRVHPDGRVIPKTPHLLND